MQNPYQVTRDFEQTIAEYTGAPYVVCVNSGTVALQLAVMWTMSGQGLSYVEIPRRTYVSVPNAISRAGYSVTWRDEDWHGIYQLWPVPVFDCALRFTSDMYRTGQFQCVSFAAAKILGIEQGGAILHDNAAADAWLRRMRFDGRTEGVDPMEDTFDLVALHCIMLPSIAAQGLLRLHHLPKHNADKVQTYPDLSRFAETWR